MKENRKFEGVWIEKEVWVSKMLTLQEKCFFVEIKSLDNEDGCYATNEYFADFFQISKRRCISVINSLEQKGMISKKMTYKKGTKQIEKRVIRVSKAWKKIIHYPGEETFTTSHEINIATLVNEPSLPPCKNLHYPGEETFTDNSTVNSTSNSTQKEHHAEKSAPLSPDQPKEETPLKAEKPKRKKVAPKKENAIDFPQSDEELTQLEETYTFDQFWSDYDYKIDRAKCKKKFNRLKNSVVEQIRRSVKWYVADTVKDDNEQGGTWRPRRKNPLTYLNSETYKDYTDETGPKVKQSAKIRDIKRTNATQIIDSSKYDKWRTKAQV